MNENLSLKSLLILALLAGIFWYTSQEANSPQAAKTAQLAAVLATSDPLPPQLGVRTKTGDCQLRGPLPDPACSPGAVFPEAAPEQICVPGYTKTARNVSASTKKKVFQEYGISYPQPFGSYEVDHIIPLELGGSNDLANLYPEAASPPPGFKEKDLVENYLNQQVCAGRANLARAQEQIARDWTAVYDALTPQEIQQLKAQYRSWAGN